MEDYAENRFWEIMNDSLEGGRMATLKEMEFKGKLAALMLEYKVKLECWRDMGDPILIYSFKGPNIRLDIDDLYEEFK